MDGSSSSSVNGSNSGSSAGSSFLQLPHVLNLPLMIGGGARVSDISAEVARRLIEANAELPSLDASIWQQQQQQQQQGISAIQVQSQAIRSAMLLEQAAVCLEQAGPSHWRKRNFQLVMAGHTYYKAGETTDGFCMCLLCTCSEFRADFTLETQEMTVGEREKRMKSSVVLPGSFHVETARAS